MKKHILLSLLAVAGLAVAADSIDLMVRKITGSNTPPTTTGSNLTAFALQDKSNNVVLNAYHGSLQIEGSTFNDHQTTLAFTEPTADRTVTFQNATGTVALETFESVTATNVITASENGKVFLLNSATEFVSTLPAPAVGLHYTFIVVAAPASASYTVVTTSSANVIKGMQVCAADAAGDTGTADDTVTFVDGQAVAGDMIEVWSDGTSWFAVAKSRVAAGITFTQAS